MNTTTKPELESTVDEAYQLTPGCPTFTFGDGSIERTFPYNSFKDSTFFNYEGETIDLYFENGYIKMKGENLRELWQHLQMQDVRSVRCNPNAEQGEVKITEMDWGVDEDE